MLLTKREGKPNINKECHKPSKRRNKKNDICLSLLNSYTCPKGGQILEGERLPEAPDANIAICHKA